MTTLLLGINNLEFKNTTHKMHNSIYSGIDIFSKTNQYDIAYGIGFDITGLGTTGQSSLNYTMASQLKLGYSFYYILQYPVHIKAELGYGATRFYDKNYWGSQYGISIDVRVYKDIGIGIKYKHVNTGVNQTSYSSYDTDILFLQMSF